jgi:hypothetical protein
MIRTWDEEAAEAVVSKARLITKIYKDAKSNSFIRA